MWTGPLRLATTVVSGSEETSESGMTGASGITEAPQESESGAIGAGRTIGDTSIATAAAAAAAVMTGGESTGESVHGLARDDITA